MIFWEDKLKIVSKMLKAARSSCPSEAAAARQHLMAAVTMVQVVIDYEEEQNVIDYRGGENDAAFDEVDG